MPTARARRRRELDRLQGIRPAMGIGHRAGSMRMDDSNNTGASPNSHKSSRSRKPMPEPCHISTLPDNWKPNSDRKVKQSMTSSFLRSRRRHSRPNIEPQQSTVTEDQAAWFLGLPDKVKRQHFSKEEQTLLADRCEAVLQKQAPKPSKESKQEYCRRRLTTRFEDDTDAKPRRRLSAPVSRTFDEDTLAKIAAADAPEAVEDGDEDDRMAILSQHSRRHSVATTREALPPPPVVLPAQLRSFRRSFALRPLPLPAPKLAAYPSPGLFNDKDKQRPTKLRRRLTGQSITPAELSPTALHYNDPEMRKQLRAMSSPELFDEALEYGFPPPPSGLPKSAALVSKFSADTSEYDRSSSLTSSSTAETKDVPFGADPSTPPGSATFAEPIVATNDTASETSHKLSSPQHLHRRAHTTGHTPAHTRAPSASHTRTPSAANREMTLRMTLTRPMLRSAETDVNALQTLPAPKIEAHDPLALESITVCDDPTGAQGAFAIAPENSPNLRGIKKALKHLVRK